MLAARHRARLTMEERNVDQREGVRYRNACRRLFQDDDEDNKEDNSEQSTKSENDKGRSNGENDNLINRLFEEARARDLENAKKKWNFDFENEVPLSGRYEWVKLDRDGNEISDSTQSRNGVCDSHEEPRQEAAEADAEERES